MYYGSTDPMRGQTCPQRPPSMTVTCECADHCDGAHQCDDAECAARDRDITHFQSGYRSRRLRRWKSCSSMASSESLAPAGNCSTR